MMLALVKCLFWIIKRATVQSLDWFWLIYLFTLFTSRSLLLFLGCMKPVIQPICIGRRGNANSNEQQCIKSSVQNVAMSLKM